MKGPSEQVNDVSTAHHGKTELLPEIVPPALINGILHFK